MSVLPIRYCWGALTGVNVRSKHNSHEVFYPSFIMVACSCMPAVYHIELSADLISDTTRDTRSIEDIVKVLAWV